MFKKIFLIIALTAFAAWYSLSPMQVSAEEEESLVVEGCASELPTYQDIVLEQSRAELDFRIAFEKARAGYHTYVQCMFAGAVDEMLGTDPELLLNPESACLAEDALSTTLKGGSPAALLSPIMSAYNEYTKYLNYLFRLITITPGFDVNAPSDLTVQVGRRQKLRILMDNEIQNSLVALDTSFITLKEMRQAFVMHVHFQCMLKHLEQYRRFMSNLRSVVTVIPPLIEDASIEK